MSTNILERPLLVVTKTTHFQIDGGFPFSCQRIPTHLHTFICNNNNNKQRKLYFSLKWRDSIACQRIHVILHVTCSNLLMNILSPC